MNRLACLLLVLVAALALPAAAQARWTAWKLSGVRHEVTWDWRDTITACTSAEPFVVAEQGSKKLLSLRPKQVHRVIRRVAGHRVPRLADGIFHDLGPRGAVEGPGRVAVHAVQVVQRCRITGYDETGDPQFGPDGAPSTETCDREVGGRFRTLAFVRRYGRVGRAAGVGLEEEIGAEPDCPGQAGFGLLGPEEVAGSIPPKRVRLSRFFGRRTTVSVSHTRTRDAPDADSSIVGTTTTRARVVLRRITRPERCFYGSRRPPAVVKRHFTCTPGISRRRDGAS